MSECPGYFGGCPHCHRDDGYLDVGREHWFVCVEHRTKWFAGSNLFSSWREQTPLDRLLSERTLARFRAVKPIRAKDIAGGHDD